MGFHSPVVEKPGSFLVEISAGFDSGGHFCNLELGDLKRGERLSKLLPLSDMLNSLLHGSLGQPNSLGTDMETGVIKEHHKLLESFSCSSDKILFGYPDIAERDFSSIRGTEAEFVFQLGRLKAFAVCLDRDDTKPVVPGLGMRFCHAKNLKEIGKGPAGDECLGAIDAHIHYHPE